VGLAMLGRYAKNMTINTTAILLGFSTTSLLFAIYILEVVKGRDWKEIAAAVLVLGLSFVCTYHVASTDNSNKIAKFINLAFCLILILVSLFCLKESL
jgi:amino acid transporter